MLRIRLRRVGAKKKPSYRVVVAEARTPRDGAFIEILGHYNPLTHPSTVVIDEEKALKWLRQGAQPTDRVLKLMTGLSIWQTFKGGRADPGGEGTLTAEASEARPSQEREAAGKADDERTD
ncbi:MAG: 30S ribosomal protein S16 [Chloroflexi bacterium]|nr:30S ribosomal protein S16 [Chloroflexota bacterium]